MRPYRLPLVLSVLIVLGMVACTSGSSESGSSSTSTVIRSSQSATRTPTTTLAESPATASPKALLQAVDLPLDGWGRSTAPLWIWGSRASITVHFCDKIDVIGGEPPMTLLEARSGIAWEADKIGVNEAVFTDGSGPIGEAFDQLVDSLNECLAHREQWLEPAEGFHYEVHQLDLPGIGDESFGLQYAVIDDTGGSYRLDHRMAVVHTDTKLVVIELSESFTTQHLLDAQFLEIVHRAMERIGI